MTECSSGRHQWLLLDLNPGPVKLEAQWSAYKPWLLSLLTGAQQKFIFGVV